MFIDLFFSIFKNNLWYALFFSMFFYILIIMFVKNILLYFHLSDNFFWILCLLIFFDITRFVNREITKHRSFHFFSSCFPNKSKQIINEKIINERTNERTIDIDNSLVDDLLDNQEHITTISI